MAKMLFRNLKGFYFGGNLFAPERAAYEVLGTPGETNTRGAEAKEAQAEKPPTTAEQVAKAKAEALSRINTFKDQIKAMEAQAGGNQNKRDAARFALDEVTKLEKQINNPGETTLTPEAINNNILKITAIVEYPAEKAKLDARMGALVKKKEESKRLCKEEAKVMLTKVFQAEYFKKASPAAKAEFQTMMPAFEEEMLKKLDERTKDIDAKTSEKYTLQYVMSNPGDRVSVLNQRLDDMELNMLGKDNFRKNLAHDVIEDYFHRGQSVAISDFAKEDASSNNFIRDFDRARVPKLDKAIKDNKTPNGDALKKQADALYVSVSNLLATLTGPGNEGKRAVVMAYYADAADNITCEAKGESKDYVLTQMTVARAKLSQADAEALATALGIDQKTLTGKEKAEPPKAATIEVTTPAAQPAEAPKGPPDAPQLQRLIKENAPQDLIEMFKLAQSQGLSEYYDALAEIALNGEKPAGANFQLRFNKEFRTYRFVKEDGAYKIKTIDNKNLFTYATRAQAMNEIIKGDFMQSLNYYSGPVTSAFVNNPDKNRDNPWYKMYEKEIGKVEVANFDKNNCSVVLNMDWENGDTKVEARVLPHGMISYRVTGNHVGYRNENFRVGESANFDDFMKQLERIKKWAENFEDLAGQNGWDRSPAYLRETQSSWINNPRLFVEAQQWIGRPVNFETKSDGHTEMYLDWTNTGEATPTGANPMVNMRVLNNGMIQYDMVYKGVKQGPWQAPNVFLLRNHLTDLRNWASGKKPEQPAAAGVPAAQPQNPSAGPQAQPSQAPAAAPAVAPPVAQAPVAAPGTGPAGAPAPGPSTQAPAASERRETTAAFAGLNEDQKKDLGASGVREIKLENSPQGRPSTALYFDSGTKVSVKSGNNMESYTKEKVWITHDDTQSVQIMHERSVNSIKTIIVIKNKDGSTNELRLEKPVGAPATGSETPAEKNAAEKVKPILDAVKQRYDNLYTQGGEHQSEEVHGMSADQLKAAVAKEITDGIRRASLTGLEKDLLVNAVSGYAKITLKPSGDPVVTVDDRWATETVANYRKIETSYKNVRASIERATKTIAEHIAKNITSYLTPEGNFNKPLIQQTVQNYLNQYVQVPMAADIAAFGNHSFAVHEANMQLGPYGRNNQTLQIMPTVWGGKVGVVIS